MGQIIRRLQGLTVFDDALRGRMIEATKRRNFLIHHFLRDRMLSLTTRQGMRELQDELDDHIRDFDELSDEIDRAIKPLQISFGLDPAESETFADQMAARIFPQRVILRK
jgi:hypothetical protein